MNAANPPDFRKTEREAALSAYQRHDANAADMVAAALALWPLDGGLLIADATLGLEQGRTRPLDRISQMVAAAPDWLDGHVAVAQLRWGAGDRDNFLQTLVAALKLLPRHVGLWARYMSLLADSGQPGGAADVAARLRAEDGDTPALCLLEARYAGVAGDHARAGALLALLPQDAPDRGMELARHLLRICEPDAAEGVLAKARADRPEDLRGWALTELAWRAMDDRRHKWLVQPGMVCAVDVALDGDVLCRAADRLRRLHQHRWPPLGQSVRDGTQTRGNLRLVADPVLEALFAALDEAIAHFQEALPPHDPGHPILRYREDGLRMTSSWSIRIAGAGYHVSHIHPHGVLSSAFHVAVPEGLDCTAKEGWLELGRPPIDVPLPLEPLDTLEPRPGRVTLFPSFLYHGTRPFNEGERMAIAFDVGKN